MNSKKISLRGISGILSEKELKNILGGSGSGVYRCCCGMGENVPCYTVNAISLDAAMDWVETYCPTLWGTDYGGCFM